MENRAGHGPCYLKTDEITKEQEQDLYKAYLNMAPSQTLKWLESGKGPSEQNVEIEGTEPYIVGGHTASGYWVDNNRETTIHGLFAAGDVAGGCPQKYVTGALAEGEIAAEAVLGFLKDEKQTAAKDVDSEAKQNEKQAEYEHFLKNPQGLLTTEQLEETMQKIMDQYAGGIATDYRYNESRLALAKEKITSCKSWWTDLRQKTWTICSVFTKSKNVWLSVRSLSHICLPEKKHAGTALQKMRIILKRMLIGKNMSIPA